MQDCGIAIASSKDRKRRSKTFPLFANVFAYGTEGLSVDSSEALARDISAIANSMTLSVTNGGDPIPPHMLAKVFEPYWRPPSSTPGGGLGLGLYICKQIVEAHQGTLEVCRRLGTLIFRKEL